MFLQMLMFMLFVFLLFQIINFLNKFDALFAELVSRDNSGDARIRNDAKRIWS